MTYNKSEIMKKAWAMYKAEKKSLIGTKRYNFATGKVEPAQVQPFATFLKKAWAQAKNEVAARNKEASATIQDQIATLENIRFSLNMKSLWSNSDFELDSKYSRQIAELKKQLVA